MLIHLSPYQCRGPKAACTTSAMALSNRPAPCDGASLLHKRSGFFANSEVSEGHFRRHILVWQSAQVVMKIGAQKIG